MKPNSLIGYAADFVGFFVATLSRQELGKVREIILFGSAVRGEAGPASDVDLFIDTTDEKRIKPRAETALVQFEDSVKVRDYWRLLGVRLPISLKVGNLQTWQSLTPALEQDGRVLYGFHRPGIPLGSPRVLLTWRNISSARSRTNIYRNLFGYVARGKRYKGLLERHAAEALARGSILIPLEALPTFRELFRKHRVTCQLRVLFEQTSPATTAKRRNSRPGR